jgi:ribonuclease R
MKEIRRFACAKKSHRGETFRFPKELRDMSEHMEPREIRLGILEIVQDAEYYPVKPKMLARRLGIVQTQGKDVRKVVKQMVLRGELVYEMDHKIRGARPGDEDVQEESPREDVSTTATAPEEIAPEKQVATAKDDRPTQNQPVESSPRETPRQRSRFQDPSQEGHIVIGAFRRNDRGFGFVRPHATDDSERTEEERADIYIPGRFSRDASTGDIVAVGVSRRRNWEAQDDRGPRGRIIKVVERESHKFVGTYHERRGGAYVKVDGRIFSDPVAVGAPRSSEARDGDKVVIEIVRFPTHEHGGEGVVVEVLGERGKPGLDTLLVVREFNLPDHFDEPAKQAARTIVEAFNEDDIPEGRHDAIGETTVTIDPPDARDYDDAISLIKLENGHWRLGVHIADVSHFVRPKSPLDREARERGTSVYLPDRVIPMLPEVLSNGLASLQPERVRMVKTAYLEFDPSGIRVATEIKNAVIRSDRRLTYQEVDEFIADPAPFKEPWGDDVHGLVGRMYELAMILRHRRIENGALELSLPEVRIVLDDLGNVGGARVRRQTEANQIIEEFMLAANEAVAETLADAEIPFLRRNHKDPALRKLKAFDEFVHEVLREGQADELPPLAESFEKGELVGRFAIQRLLKAIEGRPEERAINFALLRSLQRAEYGPHDEGHYALASRNYCHFTSPIRRYPDLHVHRLLEEIIAGRTPSSDFDQLLILGRLCSDREQRAEKAERELTKLKLLEYMSGKVGEEMTAVVTGIENFGMFVQGVELPAEGLIALRTMGDDVYTFERKSCSLTGRKEGNAYRLGDIVQVEVLRVDKDRRELDFKLTGVESRAPREDGSHQGGRRGRGFDSRGPGGNRSKRGRASRPGWREPSSNPQKSQSTQNRDAAKHKKKKKRK